MTCSNDNRPPSRTRAVNRSHYGNVCERFFFPRLMWHPSSHGFPSRSFCLLLSTHLRLPLQSQPSFAPPRGGGASCSKSLPGQPQRSNRDIPKVSASKLCNCCARLPPLYRRAPYGFTPSLGRDISIAAVARAESEGRFDRHGLLKGMNFSSSMRLNVMIAEGRAPNYSTGQPSSIGRRRCRHRDLLFLCVPPRLALLFAPFRRSIRFDALGLWTAFSMALYILLMALMGALHRVSRHRRSTSCLAATTFTPFRSASAARADPALRPHLLHPARHSRCAATRPHSRGALGSLAFKLAVPAASTSWRCSSAPELTCRDRSPTAAVLPGCGEPFYGSALLPFEEYLSKFPVILMPRPLFEPKLWRIRIWKGFCGLLVGTGHPRNPRYNVWRGRWWSCFSLSTRRHTTRIG